MAAYVAAQRLKGVERFPLVLMLEPLYRCNLACAGCGKIQHPEPILQARLSPEECWAAADECGAPVVSIPGGEPLIHPEIGRIVEGLIERKKFVYLCTNAILLEKEAAPLHPRPIPHLLRAHRRPARGTRRLRVPDGGVRRRDRGRQSGKAAGFRVTTNSTFFLGTDPERAREMFDELTAIGVDGLMLSPGYPYEKAPDQEHFLQREQTRRSSRRSSATRPRAGRSTTASCSSTS